ncbi:MAG TPA: helix-turn-helix domain-containing protein [Thermomicrobiales bacterium]|nr:helix-turn-helix domain-containing protein [Thermomicrobiales bacterium]HRA48864.1 helix-turn-helix domain-containing protein [Thermomicrobiales bacterium]
MSSVNIPGLLTVADAAQVLDRSTEQVRRYLREGRLKGRRLGGQWFIDDKALDAFRQEMTEANVWTDRLKPASAIGALDAVVGIGHGGGSNIAEGKDAYRRSAWWRR